MIDRARRLVTKAKAGDRRAFSDLVRMHQDRVLHLAYDFLGSWDEAKDIAQDVFIKAYQKMDDFEGKSKFSTWIYRITANLCIDYQRKKKRSRLEPLDHLTTSGSKSALELSSTVEVGHKLEQQQLRKLLESGLNELSANQRAAIVLRFFNELPTREIAEILNCSENTARIHVFRGLNKLKTKIKVT